jgi:hypothetical protein
LLNIFDALALQGCGEMLDTEIRLTPTKSPEIFAESGQANVTPEATRVRH